MNTRWKPWIELACGHLAISMLAVAVAATFLTSPALAGQEECIQAKMKHTVRMPHGETVGPGLLRLCREKLSPVSHLHRTVLDGHPVALLISHTRSAETDESPDPAIVLHRTEDGGYELVGYVLPDADGGKVHRFVPYGRKLKTKVTVSEPRILIAAVLD